MSYSRFVVIVIRLENPKSSLNVVTLLFVSFVQKMSETWQKGRGGWVGG